MLGKPLRRFICGNYISLHLNISSCTIEMVHVRYMRIIYKPTLIRKTFISYFVVMLLCRLYIRGEEPKIRLYMRGRRLRLYCTLGERHLFKFICRKGTSCQRISHFKGIKRGIFHKLNSILKLTRWFYLRLYVRCFKILAELILVCLHCGLYLLK